MLELIFSAAFMGLGIAQLIGGKEPAWVIYTSFGLSALWTLSYRLFVIFGKLKEIQEGLYASFYMQNKEEIDGRKE